MNGTEKESNRNHRKLNLNQFFRITLIEINKIKTEQRMRKTLKNNVTTKVSSNIFF